ncbi:ATP-dependent DNA helicase RecG [Draconibacterium orientale]|uniref:ATP-dependent DNA helicase RecG n=1 Tax=Draconibacterium orientale TaxID=1168034 RepID=X5DC62_9BACT|nr:ATP-binding protein [Draconibacterium orientale]AHW60403.1 transcriptional regulator [Draconibacterium orientale]SET80470.1 ATP-dependent DNA helicase RecG [Draconibacterium orientale]
MPESQNIEWKESWRDEYLKWICGFANAKGGKIIIGKNDNGEIVGVAKAKRLMEDIPNKIQTQLGIICDVDLKEEDGKDYIEIDVKPYDVLISYQGKYHYRSGSTKQELKGNALNNLLLKKAGKTWDDVVEPRANFEDIDLSAIEAFKKGATISKRLPFLAEGENLEQILDNLLLLEGGNLKRSAILLFGKNPCRFFINAFVKIGRFGQTDDDLRFQEVIEGNAFQLADKVLEVLDRKFFVSPISYKGLQRVESWEYPYEAIREVILNAIVHRDYMGAPIQISVYDDKLIVWNEGSLPEDLTFEDLKKKHSSRPHNPILASAFFKGGLIEAWGRGTIKIINECKKAGLPEPVIESSSGGISVTVMKPRETVDEEYYYEGLNARQIKAVEFVKENGKIKNSEYQIINSISQRTATRELKELVEKGFFTLTGIGAGAVYKIEWKLNK